MKLSNLRFFCLADSQSNNPLTSEVLLYYSEKLILLFNPIFWKCDSTKYGNMYIVPILFLAANHLKMTYIIN